MMSDIQLLRHDDCFFTMAENDPATAIGSNVEKIPAARENEDQPHNLKRKKHQLVEPTRRSVRQEKRDIPTKHLSTRFQSLFFNSDCRSLAVDRRTRQRTQPLEIPRWTLYQVHDSPHIYRIDDFLTEGELKHLEELILKSKFAKSFVDTDSSDVIYDNTHRTSTFVALEKQGSAKLSGIERKAADLLGVSTVQVEPLQLVRYRRDEFFGIHHDLGTLQDDGSVPMPPKQSFVKRRLATIFCYLNDVENGGCTFFPKCQLRVEPKRGRAVVFCNILETGLPDPKTVHAGERVKQGCKYGLNIWITEE